MFWNNLLSNNLAVSSLFQQEGAYCFTWSTDVVLFKIRELKVSHQALNVSLVIMMKHKLLHKSLLQPYSEWACLIFHISTDEALLLLWKMWHNALHKTLNMVFVKQVGFIQKKWDNAMERDLNAMWCDEYARTRRTANVISTGAHRSRIHD